MNIRQFLLLPQIQIHNANAMSSPYTIGFPAMTAWLGAVHALQRQTQLHENFAEVIFTSVAISCHRFNLQTYKGDGDFVHSIIGTANPLDKNGDRPAFVEEARCHLTVSLLIEYQGLDFDLIDQFKNLINTKLQCMKFASGDVLAAKPVETITVDEDDELSIKKVMNKLMLGYVIIERRDLMLQSMQEGKDALDALLDHLKIMHRSQLDAEGNVTWVSKRKTPGWLVPISVGFQAISDLGFAKHQRDENTLHRFAESVVTLGEFKLPYRIHNLDEVLWKYQVNNNQNLYLCQTLSNLNTLGV